LIPYFPEDETSYATALTADEKVVQAAISFGGTATGEHGIGIGKRRFMSFEHGESLKIMQGIKDLLDPQGILNPGKIFPDTLPG
jgi:D-lactate dehydrogenase (cytochrome)